ncbi:signal transduction protein [Thermotomaculum hydrothermale]|uniref:diguanylate cyclase n=1 Tax=Thermotomaculum hydrothermale TaxID=981385 RepID=A0A7R6PMY6_9BACT|nr:diguanylate cyclase [Thermotomaculum hydrothermale]BBB32061.1 signal transduction protein [Thermotomaculum hydrothermale]
MKIDKKFLIIFVFILFSLYSKSQLLPLKKYFTENGLVSSQVWSIIEDKHGYIWFGCSSGISKFNGFKFTNFRLQEGLPSESINKLEASKSGIIVASTVKGLAYITDWGKEFKEIPNIGECSDIVIFDSIKEKNKFLKFKPFLFACVKNKGIYRFDFEKKTWSYFGFKKYNPTAIQFLGTKIVFASQKGYIFQSEINGTNIKLIGHTKTITKIKRIKKDKALLISEKAIYLLSNNKINTLAKAESNEEIFFDALIDFKNNLWIASNFGLRKTKEEKNILYTSKNGIPGIRVLSAFESKEGILWFGTNHGVCKLISEDILVFRNPEKRSSSSYISFYYDSDKKTMMIGNTSGVVLVKNNKTKILKSKYLLKFPVWAINKDKKNNYYFATEGGGIVKRSLSGKEWYFKAEKKYLPGNNVTDILIKGETIYASCKEGFAVFKNNKWKVYNITNGLPVSYVRCLENYSKGRILLGTLGNGILIYEKEQFFPLLKETPKEIKSVYAIYYDSKKDIVWAATNYGLAKVKNGKYTLYNTKNGFLPFGLSAVYPVKEYLWIGSDGGALLFDPKKEKVIKILTKDDGLPGNEFTTHNAIAKDDKNHIWFGFFGGAARLDNLGLNEQKVKEFNPKILLTSIKYYYKDKIFTKTALHDAKIIIPYGAKEIFITFDIIWFRNEYSLSMDYKLKGINTNWNKIKDYKDLKIYFTSISPGKHPLFIRISSILSSKQFIKKILEIDTPIPWWQKPFYQALISIFSVFFIITLVQIFSYYKTKKLEEEKRILNKLVEKRTAELASLNKELEEKNNILKELANHDYLTGLYNRRFFMSELNVLKNIASREKNFITCFLIFDIDNFKKINDTYGHIVGDEVLRAIATIIQKNLRRKSDIAARYGGEEFIVALLKSNKKSAMEIAENIRQEVETTKIQIDELTLSLTISGGVHCIDLSKATNKELNQAIEEADKKLYLAKNRGKNRIEG